MVKISTLLYICDNLDEENERLIDIDSATGDEECEYKDVWQFLNDLIIEADQSLVSKIINQTCQR